MRATGKPGRIAVTRMTDCHALILASAIRRCALQSDDRIGPEPAGLDGGLVCARLL
jgi:hypothetical protein